MPEVTRGRRWASQKKKPEDNIQLQKNPGQKQKLNLENVCDRRTGTELLGLIRVYTFIPGTN